MCSCTNFHSHVHVHDRAAKSPDSSGRLPILAINSRSPADNDNSPAFSSCPVEGEYTTLVSRATPSNRSD